MKHEDTGPQTRVEANGLLGSRSKERAQFCRASARSPAADASSTHACCKSRARSTLRQQGVGNAPGARHGCLGPNNRHTHMWLVQESEYTTKVAYVSATWAYVTSRPCPGFPPRTVRKALVPFAQQGQSRSNSNGGTWWLTGMVVAIAQAA